MKSITTETPALHSTDEILQQALQHHVASRFDEAERLYREILRRQLNHPGANHNLGVLAVQLDQPAAGLPYFKAALEADPRRDQSWLSYVDALIRAGQLVSARAALDQARRHGLADEIASVLAEQLAAQTAVSPGALEANTLTSLFEAGNYAEGESFSQYMTMQFPQYGPAWKVLGVCRQLLGKASLAALEQATALLPEDAEAHRNLAFALKDLGQLDAAVASFRRVVEINPAAEQAYNQLGSALQDLGQLDAALACYRQALEINPRFAEAHSNLGTALRGLAKFDEAIASQRQALAIDPDYAMAHSKLGVALQDIGQLEAAVASYRRALAISPDFLEAHSNLLFCLNYLSDLPAATLLIEARRFGNIASRKAHAFDTWHNEPDPDRRLRIGLVSGDLCAHPVGYFTESMLAALAGDAGSRLEIIAYSNHFRHDALSERIKACCQEWHSVVGVADENLARQIHDHGIDILIDLSGHTASNRLPLFAWKPAPVQASWLGYFATTGIDAMDYLIADPWTVPTAEQIDFSEQVWRLPETYLCFTPPDVAIEITALPALANGHITFGCFNNLTKINDAVVALWAKVLLAVPGSRLFLKTKQLGEASVQSTMTARFAAHGIAAERLILEPAAPRATLLAAYNRIDIALDPFPFPGGTTSAEALWMGVPVLSLAGNRFLSHIGESILHNAGLTEWIAADAEDYVARAHAHAADLPCLSSLHDGLRQQVLASPLFDAPRFARHFEAALRGMWIKWCEQQRR